MKMRKVGGSSQALDTASGTYNGLPRRHGYSLGRVQRESRWRALWRLSEAVGLEVRFDRQPCLGLKREKGPYSGSPLSRRS